MEREGHGGEAQWHSGIWSRPKDGNTAFMAEVDLVQEPGHVC